MVERKSMPNGTEVYGSPFFKEKQGQGEQQENSTHVEVSLPGTRANAWMMLESCTTKWRWNEAPFNIDAAKGKLPNLVRPPVQTE